MAKKPDTAIEAGAKKAGISAEEGSRASAVVATAAEKDPVLRNELNEEPWWQSGVGVFGSGGLLWSIGVLFTEVGKNGLDIASYNTSTTLTAVGSLSMFGAVLYRRFVPGLKPMFHGWFKKGT